MVLLEQHEECPVRRRYLSETSMRLVLTRTTTTPETVPVPVQLKITEARFRRPLRSVGETGFEPATARPPAGLYYVMGGAFGF
jgi:hypothetical protein